MRHYLLVAFFAASLCTLSCRDELNITTPKTELKVAQEETLTLPAKAISHRIEVKTNREDWACMSRSSWLQAKVDGNHILLVSDPNPETKARRAVIQVSSGDAMHSFTVVQEGKGASLDVSNLPGVLEQWETIVTVDVNSNTESWTAKSDQPWVELTPKYRDDQLVVKVHPNDSRQRRQATIVVMDQMSGVEQSFRIEQKGMIYFIMPFTDYENFSRESLLQFELDRNSQLEYSPTEFNTYYRFRSTSPIFHKIIYHLDIGEQIYKTQMMFAKEELMATDEQKQEYYQFLLGEGFEDEGFNIYYSEKYQSEVELHKNHVLFTYFPRESGVRRPIEKLPLDVTKIYTTTVEEVKKYEQDKGSQYDTNYSREDKYPRLVYRSYEGEGANRKLVTDVYYFNSQRRLIEAVHYYEDIEKYMYSASNGNTYFTREFRKAIRKAGFKFDFYSEVKLRYSYLSADRRTQMIVEQVKESFPLIKGDTPKKVVKVKFQNNHNFQG